MAVRPWSSEAATVRVEDTAVIEMARWAIILGGMAAMLCAGCGTSLHDAVARCDTALVEALLERNPELVHARNEQEKTPLHYAVIEAQLDKLPILHAHGADLNAADITGMTPLHVAAARGRRDEAAWLLDHGAELEPQDNFGDTPLHTAAIFDGGLITPLVRRGADLHAVNHDGLSPLEVAEKYGNEAAASLLRRLHARQPR